MKFKVMNDATNKSHGEYDSHDEARGAVEFDRLTHYSIWHDDERIESVEISDAEQVLGPGFFPPSEHYAEATLVGQCIDEEELAEEIEALGISDNEGEAPTIDAHAPPHDILLPGEGDNAEAVIVPASGSRSYITKKGREVIAAAIAACAKPPLQGVEAEIAEAIEKREVVRKALTEFSTAAWNLSMAWEHAEEGMPFLEQQYPFAKSFPELAFDIDVWATLNRRDDVVAADTAAVTAEFHQREAARQEATHEAHR